MRIKFYDIVNNYLMREIGNNLNVAKERVRSLLDIPVLIKISTGKGKHTLCRGRVSALFPCVFCVQLDSGELKTFSYSDVHTKSVILLNKQ